MASVTLKDLIFDAYAQAVLAAKQKGLKGEDAQKAAIRAAANVVSKASGKNITEETVQKAIALK
ncbi:Mg_chelatase_C domain-containing protein [Azospirillaceae bacterium]